MFGIDNTLISQIGHMPGSHTWAVFYMYDNRPEIERALQRWIDGVVDNLKISSILQNVLFLYLEHRAIIRFKQREQIQDDLFDDFLPVIDNPYYAADYGTRRSYWTDITPEDVNQAAITMEAMYKGQICPFGIVPIPLPHSFIQNDETRDPFFPVGTRPLYWGNCEDNDFGLYVPSRFYGIVDLQTGHTFSTVTSKYCLYTNKQVYDLLLEVAGNVFDEKKKSETIDEFELTKKSGVCKMTVRRAEEEYQPLINDGWQAVLEGINSYDKSEPLRYTFGYKNKKYRIPLLMPEYTVSIQTQHTIPFEEFREKVLEEVSRNIKFSAIEASFRSIINALLNTKLADRDMLPLYCKYFGISAVPETEGGQERLLKELGYVSQLISKCVTKFGKNAYALLHVIMDYFSTRGRYSYGNDWELGKWVHDFLEATKKEGFSISKYIGNTFYDIVSWYEVQ